MTHSTLHTKADDMWCRDVRLICDIVQLGKEVGRPLAIVDLLCRFDRWEIESVSDILHWLLVEEDVSF
jgi:hypothetical protein